jgi:DNA-binding transcriptional MerR regulator
VQNSELLNTYQDFKGNSDQLTLAAGKLAESLSLALEPSEGEAEGNERLLRYYVSINVVDKPDRQGRDAVYNFRHLLQYLTARRLLRQKFSLAKIAEYTGLVPTQSLIDALLAPPHRSEAELLVAAFKAQDVLPGSRSSLRTANQRNANNPASTPPTGATGRPGNRQSAPLPSNPIHGMADLLKEIEDMRRRFSNEMEEVRRVRYALDQLNTAINTSMRLGMRAQDDFMQMVDDIRRGMAEANARTLMYLEQINQLSARFEVQQDHVVRTQAELLDRMKYFEARLHAFDKTAPTPTPTPATGDPQ